MQEHPELIRDQFWDDVFPELPYTAAAEETRTGEPVIGAAANIEVSVKVRWIPIIPIHIVPYLSPRFQSRPRSSFP